MKISTIQYNIITPRNNTNNFNTKPTHNHSYSSHELYPNINYAQILPLNQINFGRNYQRAFKLAYKNIYRDKPLFETMTDVIENKDLLVGVGGEKNVYEIPGLPNFVVGHIRHKEINPQPQKFIVPQETLRIGTEYDFGQPLLMSEDGAILIMNKIEGAPFSINNYVKHMHAYMTTNTLPPKETSEEYLASMETMANLPQETFDFLAREIRYLSKKSKKLDIVNPNNILIDKEKKQAHFVDILDDTAQNYFTDIAAPKNTTSDLIAICCDSLMNLAHRDNLEKENADKLVALTKTIIQKCKKAGAKLDMECDSKKTEKSFKKIFAYTKEVRNSPCITPYNEVYREFAEFYNL